MSLDENLVVSPHKSTDILALDQALEALTAVDPRKAKVVELKFFGGFETDEIAQLLQVSPQTVLRDWKLAKAWLLREMQQQRTATPERWQRIEQLYHGALNASRRSGRIHRSGVRRGSGPAPSRWNHC